jgi:hypothetical protein
LGVLQSLLVAVLIINPLAASQLGLQSVGNMPQVPGFMQQEITSSHQHFITYVFNTSESIA